MMPSTQGDAALVPLPDTPNKSLVHPVAETEVRAAFASSDKQAFQEHLADTFNANARSTLSVATLQSPQRKTTANLESKPMSPEKAALAAMFDSIKMPHPISPSKSPRKASGSSILSSPSKQTAPESASTVSSLFLNTSSSSTSPSKVGSTDSATCRPHTRDSPLRRPVIISSSSSPGKKLRPTEVETENASTPLSPADLPASDVRQPRMRPSVLASSSSPSAKLSDLSLTLDTTGTQELLFSQDASFLAATATTAADVTINDSFDVSRAKARIKSSSVTSVAAATNTSPTKFGGGYKARPRCSMVPEDAVPDIKPSSPDKRRNALGLRGLGVGRVVKNAAGDDTIELNLTGSFMGNSSLIGGNLMDESGEPSLLFGSNSFSISHSRSPKKETAQQPEKQIERKGSSDDNEEEEEEEEENFERDAKNVQKWAAEAARKTQLGRRVDEKSPNRVLMSSRTALSTVTQPSASGSTVARPVSRIAPRNSLVTPTARTRLFQPRASAVSTMVTAEPALSRSGSASSGLSATSASAISCSSSSSAQLDGKDLVKEVKTPMRSRRKSTFTSTRPPVSGPARRRESLAAAAVVQAHPIPSLPSLGPATPGRMRATSTPVANTSPGTRTPTAPTSRTISKPRTSLTGRNSAVNAAPRASAPATASTRSIPRPRASLTSTTTPAASRTAFATTTATTRTPSGRTATTRSTSLAAPTSRTATSRYSMAPVEATPVGAPGIKKSASQPHGLETGTALVTPGIARPQRTLVPRASMSQIGSGATTSSRSSTLVTPRAAAGGQTNAFSNRTTNSSTAVTKISTVGTSKIGGPTTHKPSIPAAAGGFGFKSRTSAVYIGAAREPALLPDDGDKEN